MDLEKYNIKRNFKKTSEPKGKKILNIESVKNDLTLKFLIQKHDASHLHYDFRIELDGVLKSWAVPKGLPDSIKEKHLAMMVEDHPYEYKDFEGNIPEGNYGAGTVMLWDEGTYTIPESTNKLEIQKILNQQLETGSIKLILNGKKIRGQYALVKFNKAGVNAWIIIKDKTKIKYILENEIDLNISVKTARTLNEIKEEMPIKKLNNVETKDYLKQTSINLDKNEENKNETQVEYSSIPESLKNIKPMLATLLKEPFNNPEWLFEIKLDGYRGLAQIENKEVLLYSRNNISLNEKYDHIVEELKTLTFNCILDGEIVAMDNDGKSNFQLLQSNSQLKKDNIYYYVYDILYLNGKDLINNKLINRKQILKEILPELKYIKFSDHILERGEDFFKLTQEKDLEGIIGKEINSTYEINSRSSSWVKIKNFLEQEVVIGGYTYPTGSRKGFGSLLIGVYQDNKFNYIGHTGTGFDDETIQDVKTKLDKYIIKQSPFINNPRMNNVMNWIEPKIVCQIKFGGWTDIGYMRQAVFLGLREDKDAKEVIKEEVKSNNEVLNDIVLNDEQNLNKKVNYTHINKVYWPDSGFTKKDLIKYYESVSDTLLPYLKDRPQSLNRHPNGINGEHFFQKNFELKQPIQWLHTKEIKSESNQKQIHYLLCQNKETLSYMINLGCIEINPWDSTIKNLNYPDYLIFDLDPQEVEFKSLIDVVLAFKNLLDSLNINSYAKTSGKRGIHIYVPLEAKYTFDQVQDFTKIISLLLQKQMPDIISLERNPKERIGKIYIDYLQNRLGQTTASVYSVRPVEGATVSTPLTWDEVNYDLNPKEFNILTIPDRLKEKGDLWAGVIGKGIDMLEAIKILNTL